MCLVGSTWVSPFQQQYRYTRCAEELQAPTTHVLTEQNQKGYSTKQKPQGVFLILSRPMTILLTSPHLEKSSWICSSVV